MTYDPVLPVFVQVIVLVVPLVQLSPPFGDVTVIDDGVLIMKLLLLVSVYAELVVLVILTL